MRVFNYETMVFLGQSSGKCTVSLPGITRPPIRPGLFCSEIRKHDVALGRGAHLLHFGLVPLPALELSAAAHQTPEN